jgi:hypothetical protein
VRVGVSLWVLSWVCAFFLFSPFRCSFCILSVNLGTPYACFLIKFDLTYQKN